MKRVENLSVKNKVALGTAAQGISKLLVAFLSVFTLRYSTQYLGAEAYGQYATVVAYVTIFTLLTDLGLTAISSREIAKRPEDTDMIIGNSLAMRLLLSLAISPLIAIGGWWLYAAKPGHVRVGIALMVVTLIFGSVQSVVSALFTAKHRNDIPAALVVINKAAYLVAIVAAGALGLGFYGFVYAAIVAAFIPAVVGGIWAARWIRLRPLFHWAHWKTMTRTSIPLGVIQIINLLYYKVDTVMLSVMRSPREVGLYTIAYGIIDVVVTIPSMFMSSLMPSLAVADTDRLQQLVRRAFYILAFLALPIGIGGILLRRQIILLISSDQFVAAAVPFAILVLGAGFSYLNAAFGFAAVAVNKQSRLLKISMFTLVLNVIINLFTIPHFGVAGAATATLITEMIACVGVYSVFSRQTGITVQFWPLWKVIIAALAMIPAAWLAGLLHVGLVVNFLLVGAAVSGVYLGLVIALGALPSDFQPLLKRLLRRK